MATVKPFSRSGQRGRKNSWRMMRGRFGASRSASPTTASVPVAAAARRNWRLVVGINSKRASLSEHQRHTHAYLQNNRMEASEVKRSEEVDAANSSAGRKWTLLKAIRSIEETGAQHSCGIRQIYIIKRVAGGSAESQSVTAVRAATSTHLRSAAKHRTTASAAAVTATAAWRTALSLILVAACTLQFGSESDGLGEPKIQDEVRRAGAVVDGNYLLTGCGQRVVESAERRAVGRATCGAGIGAGGGGNKSGTIVEDCISIQIIGSNDVKGCAGTGNQKRAQTKKVGQAKASAEKQPMPGIEGGAAVVVTDVVGVRREAGNATRIAIGIVQGVETEELNLGANAHIRVHDELVLSEVCLRCVLIDLRSSGS